MTDRQRVYISELKLQILEEQGGLCASCREPMELAELAHRIPKTKSNIRTYGAEVIHHRINLRLTHPGKCNSDQLVSFASRPLEAQAIVEEIKSCIE